MAIVVTEAPGNISGLRGLGIGKNEKLLLGVALAFGGGYLASRGIPGAGAGATAAQQAVAGDSAAATATTAAAITAATRTRQVRAKSKVPLVVAGVAAAGGLALLALNFLR